MTTKSASIFKHEDATEIVSLRVDGQLKQAIREIAFREDVKNSHVLLAAVKRGLPIVQKELEGMAAN